MGQIREKYFSTLVIIHKKRLKIYVEQNKDGILTMNYNENSHLI